MRTHDHCLKYIQLRQVLTFLILSFVSANDRVLRHGMDFQYYGPRSTGMCASTAHVELYHRDQEGDWRFLGRCTAEFSDHIVYAPAIQPLGLVPLAGDIIFDRYCLVHYISLQLISSSHQLNSRKLKLSS